MLRRAVVHRIDPSSVANQHTDMNVDMRTSGELTSSSSPYAPLAPRTRVPVVYLHVSVDAVATRVIVGWECVW